MRTRTKKGKLWSTIFLFWKNNKTQLILRNVKTSNKTNNDKNVLNLLIYYSISVTFSYTISTHFPLVNISTYLFDQFVELSLNKDGQLGGRYPEYWWGQDWSPAGSKIKENTSYLENCTSKIQYRQGHHWHQTGNFKSVIESNTSMVTSHKSVIESNTSIVTSHKSVIESNTSVVTSHKSVIESNTSMVTSHKSVIESNTSVVTSHKSVIESNTSVVTNHKSVIESKIFKV